MNADPRRDAPAAANLRDDEPLRSWRINLWDAEAFVVEATSEDYALRAAVEAIEADPVLMLVAVPVEEADAHD